MPKPNDKRPLVEDRHIEDALMLLRSEMARRLSQKGQGTFTSTHEILGIITEEYTELIDAVQAQIKDFPVPDAATEKERNDIARWQQLQGVKSELLDIAVACVFGAACINNDQMDSL